jgi:hypothetical protein
VGSVRQRLERLDGLPLRMEDGQQLASGGVYPLGEIYPRHRSRRRNAISGPSTGVSWENGGLAQQQQGGVLTPQTPGASGGNNNSVQQQAAVLTPQTPGVGRGNGDLILQQRGSFTPRTPETGFGNGHFTLPPAVSFAPQPLIAIPGNRGGFIRHPGVSLPRRPASLGDDAVTQHQQQQQEAPRFIRRTQSGNLLLWDGANFTRRPGNYSAPNPNESEDTEMPDLEDPFT